MKTPKMRIENNERSIELFFADTDGTLDGKSSVLALGTFDGVHIAHQKLLSEAKTLKEKIGASLVGAWCFEESPAAILKGEDQILITQKEDKISLLLGSGLDFVAMGHFSDFKDLSAEDFISEILQKELGCIATVTGYDHRFGHKGLGTPVMLESFFGKENTATVPEIKLDGETVGSSAIRRHLLAGEIEKANSMLGREFAVKSEITEGKKLGRKLGFPTANQPFPDNTAPLRRGVYATLCSFGDGKEYMGVTNVGTRPSIKEGDDHALNCETYIIDFSGDIYGKEMTLKFCAFLREETRFSSLDELTEAIKKNAEQVLGLFSEKEN